VEDFAPLAFAMAQRVGLIPASQPLPPRPTAITASTGSGGTVTLWMVDWGAPTNGTAINTITTTVFGGA